MAISKYDAALAERLKIETGTTYVRPQALSARVGAGAYIKAMRLQSKLSQRELAEKLNLPLYSDFVSMIETGTTYVRPQALAAWAEALGVDPQEFERRMLISSEELVASNEALEAEISALQSKINGQAAFSKNALERRAEAEDERDELQAALKAIVDFCDDPNGSEKPETLASGLARLLPKARAARSKINGQAAFLKNALERRAEAWALVLERRAEAEAEVAALKASQDELLAALKAIVDFCDDPNATRRVSLSPRAVNFLPWASGLARLLPKARAAIAEAGKIRTETKTRNPSNTG